jgi:ABC-2 type transport system permease protein
LFTSSSFGRTSRISHLVLFCALLLSVAVTAVGLGVLSASLSFFIGAGASPAEQWRFAAVTFSLYPEPLFRGGVRLLLFSAIPAGFIAYVPVWALQRMSLAYAV